MELYSLIKLSQTNDKDALMEIIKRYKPLICKLSRKLQYEEAETDVTIMFIELIKHLDLNKFNLEDEGRLVSYIIVCMNSKNIDLFRKYIKNKIELLQIDTDILGEKDMDNNVISQICFKELLSIPSLTQVQKDILKEKFMFDKSDTEIAKEFNISRQSVNRTLNRGLQNIKSTFQNYVM